MTQSLGIPWAPDLRLLGHLGHCFLCDPNDPKHAGRMAAPAPACNLETVTQMTQCMTTAWPCWRQLAAAGRARRRADRGQKSIEAGGGWGRAGTGPGSALMDHEQNFFIV
jgi:hypothetical protein